MKTNTKTNFIAFLAAASMGMLMGAGSAGAQYILANGPQLQNAGDPQIINMNTYGQVSGGYIPANLPVVSPSGSGTGYVPPVPSYTANIYQGTGSAPQIINSGASSGQIAYAPQYASNIYSSTYGYGGPQIMNSSGATNTNTGGNGNVSTNAALLNATTLSANGVGTSSATLEGSYTFANNGSVMVWFEYGTTSNALNTKTVSQQMYAESANFNQKIIGLSANTTYYFRAAAQNGQTVDYGNIYTFTTKKVSTGAVVSSGGSSSSNSGNTVSNTVVEAEEIASIEDMDRSNLGALAFFGYGFFPNSLLGWILLIIIILVIILVARRYRNKDAHGHGGHH